MRIFAKNLNIQNGRRFWRDKMFLEIGMATLQRYPADQKFLCFAIFVKNSKIQNCHYFYQDKIFFENWEITLQRYPVAQKFC